MARIMLQLFVFLIGCEFSTANGISYNVETTAGEDVNLRCIGTSTNDPIISISWKNSNGSILFNCDKSPNPCETINERHTLERNNTFISTVTIRNVSLVHEDDYRCDMIFPSDREICQINLTVNVPPKGLILVEKADNTILQNQGPLTVAEGGNKTLVCKTNTSVKPLVDLEWMIPNGINVSADSQEYINDEHDKRLLVSTRTIHFTPTYADCEDFVLVCKVASNSSYDHIHTSVLILNEECKGALTTDKTILETSPRESRRMTASNGDVQGSGTSYTTAFGTSRQEPRYKQIRVFISGASGVVMLLTGLASVGCFIRSKKRLIKRSVNAESTEFRPPEGRRSLPQTPSDQFSLPANHSSNQPPPPAQLFRPVPFNPPDILTRPLVPVSKDTVGRPAERTGSRMPGETFMTTDVCSPVKQAQQELDTEMEYDLLNISRHVAPAAVPHVYIETANGLAEYAIVSRQQVDKRIDQQQLQRSKLIDDDSEYDILNTWNQTRLGTVPHVYKETKSGLAEYAVVSKPADTKKRQSLGPLTKVMKAPINVEAEYAVVDKSKMMAK